MPEDPNGRWYVRYENGKPVQSGFCVLTGSDVRRYNDCIPDIQARVREHIAANKANRMDLRAAALVKIKATAALTDAEVKALFGGG